jgi:hypothetical protein
MSEQHARSSTSEFTPRTCLCTRADNSRLLNWYYHTLNPEVGEVLAEVKKTNVACLPIRLINFSNIEDKARHDKMVSYVERMMDLHKQLAAVQNPNGKTHLQRQIDAADREIDQLVYALYGLTEEDIRIVEGTPVASDTAPCENIDHKNSSSPSALSEARRETAGMAKAPRYTGEGGSSTSESASGARRPIHGVREPTGEYGRLTTLLKNPQANRGK